MTVRFGSNIPSLNVQRQLGRASEDLSAASYRLASGKRINKASDDAAGLAIATSLRTETRIYSQGIRNLNDGLSALNIAESAMDSLGTIAARIQELAAQSMNGTFSNTQRSTMQQEATALQAEWNRIVDATKFNGVNLLTGATTAAVLQGGKEAAERLAIQVGENYDGATTRVSVGTSGVEGNGDVGSLSLSADGRYVAFRSAANNLVAGDTNAVADFFLRDMSTGVTTRINTSSSGVQGNADAFYGRLSANGRYATFTSSATNLVASDGNSLQDVFIKDIMTGEARLVSVSSTGVQGNGGATNGSISADGTFAVFDSFATNHVAGDTNSSRDVFLKNTVTGELTLVSSSQSGVIGNSNSFARGVSSDGRYVTFHSDATNLVTGDSNGARDVFVKDMLSGAVTRVSTDSSGAQSNGASYGPSGFSNNISEDGRYVTFWSTATNLVAGDTNSAQDTFVKDLWTGITTRASTDSSGAQANGNSRVSSISSDGRFIVFESDATNLVTGDTNGQFDSFIKDTLTGTTRRLSAGTDDVQGNSLSYEGVVSSDGRYALFLSYASNLVTGDTNGTSDAFLRDLTQRGVQVMAGMNVFSRASAGVTFELAKRYREEVLEYRVNLGAATSRISSFSQAISDKSGNYQEAEARIADADMAEDSALATAAQVRQQVAASLLGQANVTSQVGLRLLQTIRANGR